jgi:hypothetical protein
LAADGAHVAICARNAAEVEQSVQELARHGVRPLAARWMWAMVRLCKLG